MSSQRFSVDEALSFGWQRMKDTFFPLSWVATMLLIYPMILSMLTTFVQLTVSDMSAQVMLTLVLSIVGKGMAIALEMGWTYVLLRIVDGATKFPPGDLFKPIGMFWNYLGCTFLFGLMAVAGFVCLIVPGIIVILTFAYAPYLVVDRKLGPIQALKASAAITKGVRLELFLFGLVCAIIMSVGFACLLVGAIPAFFITTVAQVYIYRQLLKSTPELQLEPAPAG